MIHMMSRTGAKSVLRAGALPVVLSAVLALAGCAETQLAGAVLKDVSRSETPTGAGGYWKVGTPYKIAGEWYYPKDDPNYDNVGIASWYGPNFHKKKTANGEIFDMYKVSAAHPTLPMPVIARVTNLENGRALIVRVNDRGPFAHDREIDMSMRAAELLGFKEQGTTKVRVQYLSRAADWKGEQGLQTAQAPVQQPQPQAARPAARQVAAASAASMQPIRDDQPKDDDDSGIATAGLPPSPSMPMDVSLLAGAGSAAASVPSAITAPQAAPASQPPVSETPTRAMAPVTDNFFVQAGSFRSASNANSLATQLKDLGPVEVKETVVNGTPWYRVRVGPVDNAPGADSLLESVISRGQDGARVVVN